MASSDDDTAQAKSRRDPGQLLDIAMANAEDFIVELHDLKVTVKQNCECSETELKRRLTSINKSIQTAFEEKERLHDTAAKYNVDSKQGDLDFDALRTEIGRRLDELRAARDAEDVSDQPD